MPSRIQTLYEELVATRRITVPEDLQPRRNGYNLLAWARELIAYYDQYGVVVRPFDDLPQFRLSSDETISVTVQDVHRFIISDLSLIPLEIRRTLIEHATMSDSPFTAWESIAEMLVGYLQHAEEDIIREDLSWKFSPISELLWAATWFFMERQNIQPPPTVRLVSYRFPYYIWSSDGNTHGFWEPEIPLCRWEWLAIDLYRRWVNKTAGR